ncbi:hypothetical protein GR268_47695, partial [Rhizobium leguminosarum]|nr:hypothetical protein [Rhizobium leguminosarum]
MAQDLEASLQNITLALIRQRECDALEGLSVWARTMQELLQNQARAVSSASDQEDAVVPAVAAWMLGAILQSKGFYELAAEEYTRLLLQSPPLLAGVEFV